MISLCSFRTGLFGQTVWIVWIGRILSSSWWERQCFRFNLVDSWKRTLSSITYSLTKGTLNRYLGSWRCIQSSTKEWGIWSQYSMDQAMRTNKRSKRQLKVEISSGLRLKDILITIWRIMIDRNKLMCFSGIALIRKVLNYGTPNLPSNTFQAKGWRSLKISLITISTQPTRTSKISSILNSWKNLTIRRNGKEIGYWKLRNLEKNSWRQTSPLKLSKP